ncbi:MAG: hypothetical protein PHN61_13410 [Methanothrix sp.]|jgi:hypothetical protein|nr:hypothetical protein [Methanothrix sp.]
MLELKVFVWVVYRKAFIHYGHELFGSNPPCSPSQVAGAFEPNFIHQKANETFK